MHKTEKDNTQAKSVGKMIWNISKWIQVRLIILLLLLFIIIIII